jgi:hypothetical protein
MNKMNAKSEFELARKAINAHPDQMRALVLSILFENFDKWISAQEVANIVKITPKFGKRGGEACKVKHVMAKMTLGILQNRLYRNTDYRLVVDFDHDKILLTTKSKAKGMKTYVFSFEHFAGHDSGRNIKVDIEYRYAD